MGRPYGRDLRRKFLLAYDRGDSSLKQLASRFIIIAGWAKKISAQRKRSGRAEQVARWAGSKPQAGVEAQKQVIATALRA
jgi:transposase